ncbi:MAG: polysaccharide biosynthesis tyrosine autokinase [Scandinavium sp.]|uniref:polysaccharide biosynthesis tyrosine autokinase n=1 Tax=Scandinavium sp. TaxID=2830653 RepID=UPI003F39304B
MSSTGSSRHLQADSNTQEIDLLRLLAELIDHYRLILSITAAFTLIAIVYALNNPPVYQANALIQIEQKQSNALLNNLAGVLPDSEPQSDPEIALLQSRMILGKTVDALNLQTQVDPDYFPLIGRALARVKKEKPGSLVIDQFELPGGISDSATATLTVIDGTHYRLTGEGFRLEGRTGERLHDSGVSLVVRQINARPDAQFTLTRKSRLLAIADLQKIFSVTTQGKGSGMLILKLTGQDPHLISRVLDDISNHYLTQNIARQAAQDARSLDFLNAQLPRVSSDLNAAEDKLNAYRKQKDSVDLNIEAKSVLEQSVNVDNQLNELTFHEAEVSQLYKKDHPNYRALMEKRATLQNAKAALSKRVSAMPATQQEVLRLSRDVESGRAVYLQLLNRQQELSIAKSSAIGNVRIIDEAVTLTHPIAPKKLLIVLLGFILGLFLSVGLVLLRSFLRQGIVSADLLEERGISVYANVPFSEWLHQKNSQRKKNTSDVLLAEANPADQAIEAIRGLRTSLHFGMMEAKNNLLMISGATPGSGKTFISSNLAAVTAQAQKKVLFIDADMRKGYVHHLVKSHHERGLSDILSGKYTFEEALTPVPDAGFDLIARGTIPPNPSELLMHPRFEALLKEASSRYDLVIIDTPPVLLVTDASIIGRYVGTVMLVARFEANTVKEIALSLRYLEQRGIAVKGCILNGIVRKVSSYYGYGEMRYGYAEKEK